MTAAEGGPVECIGVTGHVQVDEGVATWIARAFAERLGRRAGRPLHGVTCLAQGADQIFAQAVLDLNGTFDVLLPAADYAACMATTDNARLFRNLLGRARSVRTMPFETSSREAYLAASLAMLRRCDLLLAAWNGLPSRNVGDTADVVAKAHQRQVPVEVVWPPEPGPAPVTPGPAPGPG